MSNPFFHLPYETPLEDLGEDYYDRVAPASFPQHRLRFRNNQLLPLLNLKPEQVRDDDFIEAFGLFQGPQLCLALRYHGYQFGEYNPYLGDGRGFLYGQVRGIDGELYDFGSKGSGRTPYSRTADGRLTLKGGVREVLAAETLHQLGVKTSRCLSLIETGESLWRGDEPSPTRSSVMIRFSRSHIRFGTFERLHYLQRPDLIQKLLNHVIAVYYPTLPANEEGYPQFYQELVERVAQLAAQWMAAGFCHGVLNTDNMSITGESFDYGPYSFIPTYDPNFTAAYFDYGGRYRYENQPWICKLNLEMLQVPLKMVMKPGDLDQGLSGFDAKYRHFYQELLLKKLGFEGLDSKLSQELVSETIKLLQVTQVAYHGFFGELAQQFRSDWRGDWSKILREVSFISSEWEIWQKLYYQALNELPETEMMEVSDRLHFYNPKTVLLRPLIEEIWSAITEDDDWQPFEELLQKIWARA